MPAVVRTWIYPVCWAILLAEPRPVLLAVVVLLLLTPWTLDGVLASRSIRQTRWTRVFRWLHVVPVLAVATNTALVVMLNQPAEVHHNRHHAMAAELLGSGVPVLETWYSQDRVFTGHGGEYLRIRFARENRAAMEVSLSKHCREKLDSGARWSLLPGSHPSASSMPWDPPAAASSKLRLCGSRPSYQAAFGASGDSLLLYYEGH